ncbi:MAG TPA: bacteriohopanetetrol glucosamine biosynthesis glycosyltransferase HpnI [Candidatus Limnocylindria bacterium]|nr:bacteriohopanetetrol glucosamine biosynthesis glycosyltransferase HpnI [Candidatus Limnocylindria bacterium]
MRAELRSLAARGMGALALASLAYGAFALARVRAFARRPIETGAAAPRISVLKPLHGDEPFLEAKLRSFCTQDYPDYEVILGARDADDPALASARAVAAAFPDRVRVVTSDAATPRHANPKANTLAGIVPHATGEIFAIVDSDMRVEPDYLRALAASFADPQVGAVTCLYRGEPLEGLASRVGAMGNHEHFAPSVLVAQALGPLRYCFGATMAVRREVFAAIGGLDVLGMHIADDAMLGELVAAQGLRVHLSRYVVENVVSEAGMRALWQHELRWGRTHRTLRPAGYVGLFLTYPLVLALGALVLAPKRRRALALVAAAAALRVALQRETQRAFGVRSKSSPALIPLRDLFGCAVWAAAFSSRTVRWSHDAFAVARDGTVAPHV